MGKKRAAALLALGFGPLVGCGDPEAPAEFRPQELFTKGIRTQDSSGGAEWRQYLKAEALHRAWAPAEKSPWRPYYKPTLVAAVSMVAEAAQPMLESAEPATTNSKAFADAPGFENAAVFIDLPGETSVVWAATLARAGYTPVLTFNNWPHPKGILRLERALGALLYFANELEKRPAAAHGRPAFVLESGRIARRDPGPDEFDNRYYMAAADLPTADVLKKNGITRIVHVSAGTPPGAEQDDLNEYFVGLAKADIKFTYLTVLADGQPMVNEHVPASRTTIFTQQEVARHTSSSPNRHHHYYRSYGSYHSYWYGSRGTWGSHRSGGAGGSSGSRSSWGGGG